jgi:dipeptidyl aminopeptidase/acylaminoacyl peptidase
VALVANPAKSDAGSRRCCARLADDLRDALRAPVLLVHGAEDTSAPVEESRRLERALRDRGREIELIVVPGAGHVFNFKQPDLAQQAWDATVGWLRAHLPPT